MRRTVFIILTLLLALGAVEGLAYWWMHPAPAGQDEAVLVYRPQIVDRGSKIVDIEEAPAQSSTSTFDVGSSTLDVHSSLTPLPEIVARALPPLGCSTGTAARIDREDGVTIHVAFFEWDVATSVTVLEAFKHMPEVCMGSIGMTLTAQPPPRFYHVGSETISFGHSILRDHDGAVVHAFKGTWVSGLHNLSPDGILGGTNQWKQLRWKAGLHRFRPAHARVAQGAVRGIPNPDLAWQAFEEAMLEDLRMER